MGKLSDMEVAYKEFCAGEPSSADRRNALIAILRRKNYALEVVRMPEEWLHGG